jgi:hypothetical protein
MSSIFCCSPTVYPISISPISTSRRPAATQLQLMALSSPAAVAASHAQPPCCAVYPPRAELARYSAPLLLSAPPVRGALAAVPAAMSPTTLVDMSLAVMAGSTPAKSSSTPRTRRCGRRTPKERRRGWTRSRRRGGRARAPRAGRPEAAVA